MKQFQIMKIMQISFWDIDQGGFLQHVWYNHPWDPVRPYWDDRFKFGHHISGGADEPRKH